MHFSTLAAAAAAAVAAAAWKSELCKDRVLEERGRNWHSPLFFRPYKKVCNSRKN